MDRLGRIMHLVMGLSDAERAELRRLLDDGLPTMDRVVEVVTEDVKTELNKCPYCGCEVLHKHGKRADGTIRLRCADCRKTFSPTFTGVMSGTHKEKGSWERFAACLQSGKSVAASAKECGIHINTAYRWREKLYEDAVVNPIRKGGMVNGDGVQGHNQEDKGQI